MKIIVRFIIPVLLAGLPLTGFAQAPAEKTRERRTEPQQSTKEPQEGAKKEKELEIRPELPAVDVEGNVDPIQALRDKIEATASVPDRIRWQLKLAEELVAAGRKPEALAELHLIANSGWFDPIGFYNLGNAFARLGETEAALGAYHRAIEQRKGKYSRAYNNLGVLLLRQGQWDDAYDAFIAALKLESFRYAEASYNLGRLYAARGQKDLAAREWRRALVVDPEHTAAAQALARADDDERIVVRPQVKSPAAKAAPAPRPAKALVLDQASFDFLQRARTASERGKTEEAIYNFRRVLHRQGGYFAPANLELSYALLRLKRYDEALENLVQVSQRDGARYPVSYYHLGRLHELRGNLELAEEAFSQAANASVPLNNQFLLDLSRVREKQGDFKGALDAMERYAAAMEQQGEKPVWCDERLATLRAKIQ